MIEGNEVFGFTESLSPFFIVSVCRFVGRSQA